MEDLTKTQLILLMLFVSFVISTATSIVTTTLLQEAPQEITQTINRVVERTVERVVPGTTNIIREVSKVEVVTDEDLIVKAIAGAKSSIVGIGLSLDPLEKTETGIVIREDGFILTRAKTIEDRDSQYFIKIGSSKRAVDVVAVNGRYDFAILKVKDMKSGEKIPALSLDASVPSVGKTVVALYDDKISLGTITSVESVSPPALLSVEIAWKGNVPKYGSPLLGTNGTMVGYYSGSEEFISSKQLNSAMDTALSALLIDAVAK